MLRNAQDVVLDRCQGCSLTAGCLPQHQRIPISSGNATQLVWAPLAQTPTATLCLAGVHSLPTDGGTHRRWEQRPALCIPCPARIQAAGI